MTNPSNATCLLPASVGDQPEVFFDNHLIHYVHNLTRRLHRPEKLPSPVMRPDKPWECVSYFTCNTWNVIRDPQDGKFKCWYEDWHWPSWQERKFQDSCILYAVSDDGLSWEKPSLGIRKVDGHDTNIVLGRDDYGAIHAASVFLDHLEPDPDRRFKMIYRHHRERKGDSGGKFGNEIICFAMATSPDGIQWTPAPENPITPSTLAGDVLIAVRDPVSGKIAMTGRPHNCSTWSGYHPNDQNFFPPYDPSEPFGFLNKRNVWRTESDDGFVWSEAHQCVRQDEDDNLDDGFYGLTHFRMGDLNVGILNIVHSTDDTMDIELLYSRDDWRTWHRPFRNIPYVPHGDEGAWDSLMVSCCSTPVTVGDKTFFYYGGSRNHHDWWMYTDMGPDVPEKCNLDLVEYCLGLAMLRRDGYVSLDAGEMDGSLATKPFKREGDQLEINAVCEDGGYVSVELRDINDRAWPGFTVDDCDALTGDDTAHTVTWHGNADLSGAGKYIRLVFRMKRASLYSFRLK